MNLLLPKPEAVLTRKDLVDNNQSATPTRFFYQNQVITIRSIKTSETCVYLLSAQFFKRSTIRQVGFYQLSQCADLHGNLPAKKSAYGTFHYALSPSGFLFLGKSETIGDVSDLFYCRPYKSDKVFSRKDVPGRMIQVGSKPAK